ncbi:ribosomal-processing cysteine protease Prp [endosymbiont GvMRE of Glomus versiforme]|uniref:ribosomal-processing cysteine protease Prp n=1 Tax=endosymbiont GvMRE of Glomus versiforme TaxID=2039283 RepID=UPI000EDB00B5|nr:ribosomal-processing cysteine protease Prp [endosymbiont GvMRE of Glomus versiforme]RHZ36374.1 Ribosomal protein [endosymbiont GvMRE of Glomus versiforme]
MIKVFYRLHENKKQFKYIKIQGHANSAPKGKDLVCAGISAIVNGVINFLQENYAEFCQISVLPAEIIINCSASNNKNLQLCLQMFFFQLKNVALSYPQYFQFFEKSGNLGNF